MGYKIFMCPKCGSIRYAPDRQKTAKCFGCGYQVPLDHPKVRILDEAETSRQARAVVQEMKLREATK